MTALAVLIAAMCLVAWMLHAAMNAWGERDATYWHAIGMLFLARTVARAVKLLPEADAFTALGVGAALYFGVLLGGLNLWARVPRGRAVLTALVAAALMLLSAFIAVSLLPTSN